MTPQQKSTRLIDITEKSIPNMNKPIYLGIFKRLVNVILFAINYTFLTRIFFSSLSLSIHNLYKTTQMINTNGPRIKYI